MLFKKHQDYSLLIFGFIAFLILVSIVFIMVIFLNKVDGKKDLLKEKVENYINQTSSAELFKNYNDQLSGLRVSVESVENEAEIFSLVEKVFFSIKVPQEMLDDHLQTFLKMNSLKEKKFDKEEVIVLLDNLIQKIELHEEASN